MRAALVLVAVATALASALGTPTPLDDYVYHDDGAFAYTYAGDEHTVGGNGWAAYMYNVTSQRWFDASFSSKPVWTHQMAIIIPHDVNTTLDSAFLYITGQGTPRPNHYPHADDEGLAIAAAIAKNAKSPGAVMWQVPDECIVFSHDPFGPDHYRTEDAAIAFTWWAYSHPEKLGKSVADPRWVLELPMTKAGVKAIDVIQQVVPRHTGGVAINGVYVAGASKRGWTTWLVGAVENGPKGKGRVRGIMPIVLDALNVVAFAHRQWTYYGAWTFALSDYYKMNFTQDIDEPYTKSLMQLVDPYYYMSRLTMPKLALNAVGDEFQMPDDQRHWAHLMPGEMHLLMVKNAEHSMATGVFEILQSAGAMIQACQQNVPRPVYTWSIDNATGAITVVTDTKPTVVTVTWADSPQGVSAGRRDFRWAAINASFCVVKVFGACVRPVIWETTSSEYITQPQPNTYVAQMPLPPAGVWRGFILELQWENTGGPDDFYFTSPTSVIPNTAPFPDCHGRQCRGTLC